MIIGTVTLITMLLSGGSYNTFVFSDLDKYAKKVIIDKDRKKDIVAELKTSEKHIKEYYKERRQRIKDLKKLNLNRGTERTEYDEALRSGEDKAMEIDQFTINERLRIIQQFSDEEWQSVMQLAMENAENQKAKEEKKASKDKISDPFDKIETTIEKVIPEQQRKDAIVQSLKKLEASFSNFENNILNRYPTDNSILVNKYANQKELTSIFTDVMKIKRTAFDSVVEFHFDILNQTEPKEWDKIIKEVNKLIQ